MLEVKAQTGAVPGDGCGACVPLFSLAGAAARFQRGFDRHPLASARSGTPRLVQTGPWACSNRQRADRKAPTSNRLDGSRGRPSKSVVNNAP